MFNNITFGKYYNKNSVIHRLSPVFKLISLMIMIVGIFFIDSYIDILMFSLYLVLVMVYSDIGIITYLKNFYYLFLLLI